MYFFSFSLYYHNSFHSIIIGTALINTIYKIGKNLNYKIIFTDCKIKKI
jgi:hypothetical protein